MEKEIEKSWGISTVWDTALLQQETGPVVAREKLWASEIGKPTVDLWLKLRGEPYTNPPNPRALRKFEAGNVMEWIVGLVLKRAGILKSGQQWCQFQYEGMLPVSGKADFIGGGMVDFMGSASFMEFLKESEMPELFIRGFDQIVSYLQKEYPNGLEEVPVEVKSISSYAMDLLEKSRTPSKLHRKQLFHYLKALNYRKGILIYICRDDLRMMEFVVLNPSSVEEEYRSDIELISKYHFANQMPPLETLIMFDDEVGKFSKNLGVEWSPYLKKLYGFEDPREYSEKYGKQAQNWNRVLNRVKLGLKMTEKNKLVLQEIADMGFSMEDIMSKFQPEEVAEEEA